MKKYLRKLSRKSQKAPSAIDILLSGDTWQLDENQRAAMTISCKDCDYIPKVKNAGTIKKIDGEPVQVMHNGLLVKLGGYHGEWMANIIKTLKGHHEPQEEKVFYEILKRIGSKGTMIELGSFWSYYSLWFQKSIKNAVNICCEPDPGNMEIGKTNASLNKAKLKFIHGAAGSETGKIIEFDLESKPGQKLKVPIKSVDSLVAENKLQKVDMLHMDVQGVELDALKGAEQTIKDRRLRFVIISTHHFLFSGDPLTHHKCIDYIKSLGGNIITSHTVAESFSGDGLIAASFDKKDKDFMIDLSLNHTDHSLFRPHEKDLAILMSAYDSLSTNKNN